MAKKKWVIAALLLVLSYGLIAQGGNENSGNDIFGGILEGLFGGGSSSEAPAPNPGGSSPAPNTGLVAQNTVGRLTITNIPAKYNGKFIAMPGSSLDTEGKDVFIAYGDITNAGQILAGRIQNGRATLKVWRADGELKNFNVTAANVPVMFGIYNNENITNAAAQIPTAMGDAAVNFRNGVGTVSLPHLMDMFSF